MDKLECTIGEAVAGVSLVAGGIGAFLTLPLLPGSVLFAAPGVFIWLAAFCAIGAGAGAFFQAKALGALCGGIIGAACGTAMSLSIFIYVYWLFEHR